MAASRMCQGVTKSGSPTPSEMTSFIPCTMSKKSRMPERGMSRTLPAINFCESNMVILKMSGGVETSGGKTAIRKRTPCGGSRDQRGLIRVEEICDEIVCRIIEQALRVTQLLNGPGTHQSQSRGWRLVGRLMGG